MKKGEKICKGRLIVNNEGYVCKKIRRKDIHLTPKAFLVKYASQRTEEKGIIELKNIVVPKQLIGKKLYVKIELVTQKKQEE